jgi:hypothetical protein
MYFHPIPDFLHGEIFVVPKIVGIHPHTIVDPRLGFTIHFSVTGNAEGRL